MLMPDEGVPVHLEYALRVASGEAWLCVVNTAAGMTRGGR